MGGHRERVAVRAQSRDEPEVIGNPGVGGLQISLLFPVLANTGEDVDGAGAVHGVIGLIAIDAGCSAALEGCPHRKREAILAERYGVTGQRATGPEVVSVSGVGGFQIRDLAESGRGLLRCVGCCRCYAGLEFLHRRWGRLIGAVRAGRTEDERRESNGGPKKAVLVVHCQYGLVSEKSLVR